MTAIYIIKARDLKGVFSDSYDKGVEKKIKWVARLWTKVTVPKENANIA